MKSSKLHPASGIYLALVMLFLYLPIIMLIVLSFNGTNSTSVIQGFSTKWYVELFKDSATITALTNTLILAVTSAITATVIGTLAAVGIDKMKKGVFIVNTSRGALIDSEALLYGLLNEKIGGACLDVYEEESELFYKDNSTVIVKDDILTRLICLPNVIVTSHQGFLTGEALTNIAATTLENISEFFADGSLDNQILLENSKKLV